MRKTQAQIKERIFSEAHYIIKTHSNLRQTAKVFGVSKSTVQRDVSVKLWLYSPNLAHVVRHILYENVTNNAIRAGMIKRWRKRLKK